ncbi:DNA-directed RNA polymerase sigma-70 factor [Neptunitalea chrysea]|uniref:DNA-directed RNA polymerase sigma-70 factor n=1 Tax=Neptunitalea chrysea TaxID=1647581 RepID=A0A9W6B4L6_9FLAO|nr:RNA polymerase sigma-70 factor [Neptunitalea chrysea]GLB52548.1 DNA-directed RNA polymerase sigma-70 factor [Neptunitalea chrysea]
MTSDTTAINTLVKQVKASDEKAFRKLFNLLWEPLYYYAFSLLQEESLAKDMVQDVWIDFWERRKDIQNDNIKAYLYKAVRFRVLKELRNIKFSESHLEALKELHIENALETDDSDIITLDETKQLIEKKMEVLPEKCKEVFKLSRIDGLKNKEIAEELGISESTVENHITKAFKLLKKSAALLFSLTPII